MRNELQTLQRETEKLKAQIGEERQEVVFRAINIDGKVTFLSVDGEECEGNRESVILLDVVFLAIHTLTRKARHTILHGGRAGGKSWSIAIYLVALAYTQPVKILCVREVQISIKDSVHSLLRQIIESHDVFRDFFEVLESEIRGRNGSLFSFRGMRKESAHSIKSYEGYDLCWIEEAQALSRRSIDLLIPTIRKSGSRLIWSMNPEFEEQPVYQDFIVTERTDTTRAEVLYTDNPFVSDETKADAELDKRTDFAKYRHIWLGGLREKGKGMIFPDFHVVENIDLVALPFGYNKEKDLRRYGFVRRTPFEREYGTGSVFCGLDWGHSTSPTHVVFGWITKERIIVIAEYRGVEKTLDQLATEIPAAIPLLKERHIPIWADSSRPESINFLKTRGLNVKSVPKWKNSVLEGIEKLKTATLEICEKCEDTIKDFSLYSWKLDANEEPTGEPEKKHDHGPDALRYAVWRFIRRGEGIYGVLKDPYV